MPTPVVVAAPWPTALPGTSPSVCPSGPRPLWLQPSPTTDKCWRQWPPQPQRPQQRPQSGGLRVDIANAALNPGLRIRLLDAARQHALAMPTLNPSKSSGFSNNKRLAHAQAVTLQLFCALDAPTTIQIWSSRTHLRTCISGPASQDLPRPQATGPPSRAFAV